MGQYFLISQHFDKTTAKDFGLSEQSETFAVCENDGSVWQKAELYDFGWGKECGYIKLPIPNKHLLFDIVLHSTSDDDVYGAATLIAEDYSDALLVLCEKLLQKNADTVILQRLTEIFHLDSPINRSDTFGKELSQIQNDFERWKAVAQKVTASNISTLPNNP